MDRKGAATYLFQAFVRSHRVKWHCYLDEENERRDLLMGNYAASSLHFQTISDDISNRRCFNARLEWNGTFACLGDIWKSSCRDTRCLSQEAFDVRLLVTQNATRNTLLQARSKLQQPRAIALRWTFSRKWRMQRVRQRNVWEEGARNKRKERIQEVRYAKVSPASVWIAALCHHAIQLDHFLETLSEESSRERSSFSKRIESFASLRRVCSLTRCVLLAN